MRELRNLPRETLSKSKKEFADKSDRSTIERFRRGVQTWSDKTAVIMALIACAYLATYSLETIFPSQTLGKLGTVGSTIIWWAFLVDLLIRFTGARNFTYFIKNNLLEIVTLVLPFLRMLRMFRVLLALRGLKNLTKDRLHATGIYASFLLPFIWYSGAIAVLDAEAASTEASIRELKDALWWSLSTITTVGYGDLYPTTFEGKLVAAALMLSGIALFSAAAGMFGSWIMRERKNLLGPQ